MKKRDYYEILSVSRQATEIEIKKSYRALAMKYHPDRNPGNKEAEELFKEASEAYEVLTNPEQRRVYDQYGHNGLQGRGFEGFHGVDDIFDTFGDIFEEFFGGSRRGGRSNRAQRGADLRYDLEIDFLEAVMGIEKEVEMQKKVACEGCEGTGGKKGKGLESCPKCLGRGQVSHSQGFFTISSACAYCQGQGSIISDPCDDCNGRGYLQKAKKLKVKVPPGVDNGMRLMLQGEGEPGARGGVPGDLYVFLHVKAHEFFEREGDNLHYRLHIGMAKAALGTVVKIPGLKEEEEVEIPEGVQSGQQIVLRGKGIPNIRSHKNGDFIVTVIVETPQKISNEERELLKKLAELRGEEVLADSKKKKKKSFW